MTADETHTHLLCNFPTVVKVIKGEDPLLAVVVLHRHITLQVLWTQTHAFIYSCNLNSTGNHKGNKQYTVQEELNRPVGLHLRVQKCHKIFINAT